MLLNTKELITRLFDETRQKKKEKSCQLRLHLIKGDIEAKAAASIDLQLGRWFRTMRQSNITVLCLDKPVQEAKIPKLHFVAFSSPFILHPGKFVLGITLEWLTIPKDLGAYVSGKSSLGRRGLIIETAAGIHPGFAGCLTLELANVGEIPIELRPGMPICQIFFHQASSMSLGSKTQFIGARKPALGNAS